MERAHTNPLLMRDRARLFAAAFLRATGVGLTGVLLGLTLAESGWDIRAMGLLVSLGLGGGALATVAVGFLADRMGRRWMLILLAALMSAGGLALAGGASGAALAFACFFGMVNGMGRDRGAASTLEQSILPATTDERGRTRVLSWYHLTVDAGHAAGSLAAGAPVLIRQALGCDLLTSYRWTFAGYAGLGVLAIIAYAGLSKAVEWLPQGGARIAPPRMPRPSPRARKVIARYAALSLVDSLGGGFLTGALLSYWFFRRFGIGEELLAPLFFAARVLNAVSYLLAERLARRIGLINTMVFTHLPSSLLLLLVPIAPTLPLAIDLFLLRELLVEMDVPTRQSYLLAVVAPEERTFAASMVALTRNGAWALAPAAAGWAMQALALSAPLVAGAVLKMIYDFALFASFRRLKPPEESKTPAVESAARSDSRAGVP